MRDRPRLSSDGSSAVVELWERDVRRILEAHNRHDLIARFEHADRGDPARLISAPWATKRRLARELALLAELVGELAAPP